MVNLKKVINNIVLSLNLKKNLIYVKYSNLILSLILSLWEFRLIKGFNLIKKKKLIFFKLYLNYNNLGNLIFSKVFFFSKYNNTLFVKNRNKKYYLLKNKIKFLNFILVYCKKINKVYTLKKFLKKKNLLGFLFCKFF